MHVPLTDSLYKHDKSAKNIYGFAECTNKAENNNITQWDQVSK